jgi:hypothetical protein
MLNAIHNVVVVNCVLASLFVTHVLSADRHPLDIGQGKGSLKLAQATGGPKIISLSPNKGPIGILVVIHGRNFTLKNNVIEFRGEKDFAAGSPVRSKRGTSLQFRLTPCPSYQLQCPGVYVPPGIYHVTVINTEGESNSVNFSLVSRKTH